MNTDTFKPNNITRMIQFYKLCNGLLLPRGQDFYYWLLFEHSLKNKLLFQVRKLLTLAMGISSFFMAIAKTCYIS